MSKTENQNKFSFFAWRNSLQNVTECKCFFHPLKRTVVGPRSVLNAFRFTRWSSHDSHFPYIKQSLGVTITMDSTLPGTPHLSTSVEILLNRESESSPNSTTKSLILIGLNQIKTYWEFIRDVPPGSIWCGPYGIRATQFSNKPSFHNPRRSKCFLFHFFS